MQKKCACILLASCVGFTASASPAFAGNEVRTAGEILRFALPVAAGGLSLYKDDSDGLLQLGVSEVIAYGGALVLKELIHEQRPDKSDFRSFPSDSSAVAFSAASFLQIRYGWEYGAPAYAVAAFVGYSRVQSDRHHWHDVIAGAVLGWAASEITTIRYQNMRVTATLGFGGTPLGFSLAANW